MTAPAHGFAFMRKPSELARAYTASPFAGANNHYLSNLRNALPKLKPANYRGIERSPINASYDHPDPGWQRENRKPHPVEELGRHAVADILPDWIATDEEWLIDGPWLLPDLESAGQVAGFFERPDAHELVEVALYPLRTEAAPLGFDVGYWASGNFSLVCDTAVWPLWHPAPLEALSRLSPLLDVLNDAVLFPDRASAARFRDEYRAHPWAESEGPAFEIVEIAARPWPR
jgi:hypothetical protein